MLRIVSILICIGLLTLLACGPDASTGTTISVQLDNAANLNANLDRIVLGGEKEMLKSTAIDDNGRFQFTYDEPLSAGLYQIRVGAQKVTIPITGAGGEVAIDGALGSFGNYAFTVTGSPAVEELIAAMDRMQAASSLEDVQAILEEVENPYSAAFLAFNTLLRSGEAGLATQEAVVALLPAGDPNRESYAAFLQQIRQQLALQKSQENIQPGRPAPDLELLGPDGETVHRLSDLRGQVVLLDFWAAWCVPCRRENPNVVKVYNRYKDQGFTIYSVSLDGVRPNQAARMTPEQLAQATENQRQKWIDAIEQDQLTWPYHVSELKYWNSEATAKYGVRAIPATFLIDREGKIAEVGLRGARSIERALREVL